MCAMSTFLGDAARCETGQSTSKRTEHMSKFKMRAASKPSARVGLFQAGFFWACTLTSPAWAASEAVCFDFSHKVVAPIREVAANPKGGDAEEIGTLTDNTRWAALRGMVDHPIEKVFKQLVDYEVMRDPRNTSVEITKVPSGPYLARHRVNVLVKMLFMKVTWAEDWAFALAEGTPEKPDKIVISYQKTEGTSHIARFCDSLVLRRAANGTEVSHYQEGRITGRSSQAMLEFMKLVMTRLRAPETHCANGRCSSDPPTTVSVNRLPEPRSGERLPPAEASPKAR